MGEGLRENVGVVFACLAALGCGKSSPSSTTQATPSSAASATSSTMPVAAASSAPSKGEPAPPPKGMVLVAAGSFSMGADAEKGAAPAHRVTISQPFFLDRTEVTVEAYASCVAAGKCKPAEIHGPEMDPSEIEKFEGMCNARYPDRSDHPVNCVDQAQAAAFCSFVAKRLPTEAEWEFAARGEAGRKYPWGDEEPACSKAVVSGCAKQPRGKAATQPVGSFPSAKSPEGVLDQAGNVWEWVSDGWDPDAYKAADATDPKVEAGGAFGVIRGGSWDFAPSRLVSYHRQKFNRKIGHVSTGIRCVRDAGGSSVSPLAAQGSPSAAPPLASGDASASAWEQAKARSICAAMVSWSVTRPLLRTGSYGRRVTEVMTAAEGNPLVLVGGTQGIAGDARTEAADLRKLTAEIASHSKLAGEDSVQSSLIRDLEAVAVLNDKWAGVLDTFSPRRMAALKPLVAEGVTLTQRAADSGKVRDAACRALAASAQK